MDSRNSAAHWRILSCFGICLLALGLLLTDAAAHSQRAAPAQTDNLITLQRMPAEAVPQIGTLCRLPAPGSF